jgi:glutamate synthase domain-containing protein 2
LGTAKFGLRHPDGSLDDEAFEKLCEQPKIKMIEIKLSQGAKSGKGGIMPKEKISKEISELRGVGRDHDVVSPPGHVECKDITSTIEFISHVQEISGLPTGIKLCLGSPREFEDLVKEIIKQDTFPDFITVDGAEGGTGAAPTAFLDGVDLPRSHLFERPRNFDPPQPRTRLPPRRLCTLHDTAEKRRPHEQIRPALIWL